MAEAEIDYGLAEAEQLASEQVEPEVRQLAEVVEQILREYWAEEIRSNFLGRALLGLRFSKG